MAMRLEGGRRGMGISRVDQPLVSIITVVYKAAGDLPALLQSVFRLKEQDVELIVVDGGSDDGTCELLRQHDAEIDYWISEPDRGIYDAMNKGIAAARGTFLFHLNAGDRLLSVPRRELETAASAGIDIAAFKVSIDGHFDFRPSHGPGLRLNNTLHHQGTFFRRENYPAYDLQYRIFADFDVNQRLALRGAKVLLSDQVVALHATGGISDVASRSAISEFFRVIEKNHGRAYLPAAWFLCKWRGLKSRLGLRS